MVKEILKLLSQVLMFPFFVTWKIYHFFTGKEELFVTFSQILSFIPGKTGVYLRQGFYCSVLNKCASDVHIGFGTFFSHLFVEIGKEVFIGSRCTIGMVKIGDGVMIGSNVDILSGRRQHSRDENSRLLGSDKGKFEQIEIGQSSWIGNSVVVMASIGKSCTVGAGSVVSKVVPDGKTVVGNPAKEIGQ